MSHRVVQATVWSNRCLCEEVVLTGLKRLVAPADGIIDRLWVVHDLKQQQRLVERANDVRWVRASGPVVPQYAPRDAKKLACLRGFEFLWKSLRALPPSGDVLLVDDDIVLAPETLLRLDKTMRETGAGAVSALVRAFDGGWPAFRYESRIVMRRTGEPLRTQPGWTMHRLTDVDLLPEPQDVDAVGTFCLLIAESAVAQLRTGCYKPSVYAGYGIEGHDLHLCTWLRESGWRVVLDSSVRPAHYCELTPGQMVTR